MISHEYLPALQGARQELVLLHGWGSNREIWRPLLAGLRSWANITLLDIPGCAPDCSDVDPPSLETVLSEILSVCPARAIFLGWSLGGQLAVELAHRHPERVAGVVTVCSNPRFVAEPEWPGMAVVTFDEFAASVEADVAAALRRFGSLQVQGAAQPRQLLRQQPQRELVGGAPALLSGLGWLRQLDLREHLPGLLQPQLHLLADHDGLVPAEVGAKLKHLLADVRGALVVMLPGSCHLAPLDASGELVRHIRDFLDARGLLLPAPEQCTLRAKTEVAKSFSHAARDYDSVASLQRDVGNQLLQRLDVLPVTPRSILDLGCGTGYFHPQLAERCVPADYIGLDLAEGMVEYARARGAAPGLWLVGDAEALPLATNSVDLVFSSLAIQWCDRPKHLFAELARVLRPGGRCVFTTLGPGTLHELRAAWAAVDAHQHVNTFLPPGDLESAAQQVPGVKLQLESAQFCMEYRRVRDLLDELKTLGAHNMNRDRPVGLTSRRALQGMLQAYEGWRREGLLPATYDVIFGVLEAV